MSYSVISMKLNCVFVYNMYMYHILWYLAMILNTPNVCDNVATY